jgi:hypothetical protein
MMKESLDEFDKISISSRRPLVIKNRDSNKNKKLEKEIQITQDEIPKFSIVSKKSHDVNVNNVSVRKTISKENEHKSKENSDSNKQPMPRKTHDQLIEKRCETDNKENFENKEILQLTPIKESQLIEPTVEMSEEQKELEKKRQRVYERLKASEEKCLNEVQVESNTKTVFSYTNIFKRHSEVITNSNEKPYKSPKIMDIAKRLEQQLHSDDKLKVDEKPNFDEYTKILLEKPVQVKKGRKFTKTDFSSSLLKLENL